MKNKIIEKINREVEEVRLIVDHVNKLQAEISKLQKQIDRKNGSIIGLKELLEEIQADEYKQKHAAELQDNTSAGPNEPS